MPFCGDHPRSVLVDVLLDLPRLAQRWAVVIDQPTGLRDVVLHRAQADSERSRRRALAAVLFDCSPNLARAGGDDGAARH